MDKHFHTVIIEFAAVVFLFITLPFWFPVVVVMGAGALVIVVLGAILAFIIAIF